MLKLKKPRPERGILLLAIPMQEMSDFFQKEALECRRVAGQVTGKSDREYRLRLAQRWERLVQPGGASNETDQRRSFDRPIRQRKAFAKRFAKRQAA
jgi:hypothetical protein